MPVTNRNITTLGPNKKNGENCIILDYCCSLSGYLYISSKQLLGDNSDIDEIFSISTVETRSQKNKGDNDF